VKFLIEKGVDINKANKDGFTPLYIASQEGHLDLVKLLIEKGAEINKIGKVGETPLYIASENGHLGVAKYLMQNVKKLQTIVIDK